MLTFSPPRASSSSKDFVTLGEVLGSNQAKGIVPRIPVLIMLTTKKTFSNFVLLISLLMLLAAIDEQFVCVFVDRLFNIHGKLRKGERRLVLRVFDLR